MEEYDRIDTEKEKNCKKKKKIKSDWWFNKQKGFNVRRRINEEKRWKQFQSNKVWLGCEKREVENKWSFNTLKCKQSFGQKAGLRCHINLVHENNKPILWEK